MVHQLTSPPTLKKQEKHDIEVVVDRLVVKASAKQRLTDSVETALRLADGIVARLRRPRGGRPDRERRFSERMACPNGHPIFHRRPEPRSFSFNSPYGACPTATGPVRKEIDEDLVVPDPELSPTEGAIAPWSSGHNADYFLRLMSGSPTRWFQRRHPMEEAADQGAPGDPERQRPPGARQVPQQVRPHSLVLHGVRGAMSSLSRRMDQTESEQMKERYEGYMRDVPCRGAGARLRPEILSVTLDHPALRPSPSPMSVRCRWPTAPTTSTDCTRRASAGDRRPRPQGSAGPHPLLARRRAGISVTGGARRVVVRW